MRPTDPTVPPGRARAHRAIARRRRELRLPHDSSTRRDPVTTAAR